MEDSALQVLPCPSDSDVTVAAGAAGGSRISDQPVHDEGTSDQGRAARPVPAQIVHGVIRPRTAST